MNNHPTAMSNSEAARLAESALGPTMLTMGDIAEHVGVTKRAIQAWRADGVLPAPDFCLGRVVRWRRATIEQWLSSRSAAGGRQ